MNRFDFERRQAAIQQRMVDAKDSFNKFAYNDAQDDLLTLREEWRQVKNTCIHDWVPTGSWGPVDWRECTKCRYQQTY